MSPFIALEQPTAQWATAVATLILVATTPYGYGQSYTPQPGSQVAHMNSSQAPTLQGYVNATQVIPPAPQQNRPKPPAGQPHYTGTVRDGETGHPLAGATVNLPQYGIQVQTDGLGRYTVPPFLNIQGPAIASITKAGYEPASGILEGGALHQGNGTTFHLSARQGALQLDAELRHLGDNAYSASSAHAGRFQGKAAGPSFRLPFQLQPHAIRRPPVLRIGAVIGLDTAEAHNRGQSRANVVSSPIRILVNGQLIGYIAANGTNHELPIPPHTLSAQGHNTLEIQAGFHNRPEGRRDYDDMELMNIQLIL